MKKLVKLSWRARGTGATCTAEIDQPISGYRITAKTFPGRIAASETESSSPAVSWISFDGDVYWVRLATAIGWPRTIRVTQADVDGARK